MIFRFALLLLLCVAPARAGAADAEALYAAGRYREAAVAGREADTAEGYILAGKATATMAAFVTTDKALARLQLIAAEADFDQALEKSRGNFDALLQKAVVIGYRAKLEQSAGLAKQSRRNFEAIAGRYPNNPLANAALAGWHGESVATLGKFLAGTALGAKESEAIRLYDKAMTLPGGDPMVPFFYALNLLALSPDNAPKARQLLQRSLKAQPRDLFEALVQQKARLVLAPLEKGDVPAARAAAKRATPLGGLT